MAKSTRNPPSKSSKSSKGKKTPARAKARRTADAPKELKSTDSPNEARAELVETELKEAPPARTSEPPVERTEEQWRLWTDGIVDQANFGIRRSDLEKEQVANMLFRELCGNDVEIGLDPDASPTSEYLRVRARAGKSLRLTPQKLLYFVRIGAVNQHRRDATWRNLDWSFKRELVTLLSLDDARATFNDGVQFAAGPNVGEEHVREWVQDRTPRLPGSVGRPRGSTLTLARGERFNEIGVLLDDPEQRDRFVELVDEAPAERQRELVDGLESTYRNLGKLLAALKKRRK